ncbi:hypothetical protein [Paenibacillus durus]|uniref:Replication-associated protein G2P N-terminal domain-containing protein n=1 Tax=Paenibacillus durus ATCC 35681 TaxID=1333534 RepID=A0A0F7CHE9_PAEDU|nr:hypothetical protein [Paenibacillus durus]AKG34401.1 hypothetical protein VK70_07285 [Paenibacillus durus ATCC 35681]
MFDTIIMKARPIPIDPDIMNQYNAKSTTFYSEETGVLNTSYTINDEKLPYMKYIEGSQTLTVQVSMPKFLYGDNVTMLTEADIPLFFEQLQERLLQLFDVYIPYSEWIISRCDVCCNFQVGKKVSEFVRMLSRQQHAYKNTIVYNQDQTVEYRNKSSRIMFYDKHKQTRKEEESKEIIERSKGILRLEVRPSDNDLRRFSTTRKAVELLQKPFFDFMMERTLAQIEYPEEVNDMELSWLMENRENLSKIETVLGFQLLQSIFDESVLRQLYTSSTYANRKNLAKKIAIPQGNCLDRLAIKS